MGIHRILLVEECGDGQRILDEALREHSLEHHASGDDALASLSQNAFDLLFVSFSATGDSPESFVARARDVQPGLPIVVLASQIRAEAARAAQRGGVGGVLVRPFVSTQVVAAVQNAIWASQCQSEMHYLREIAFDGHDVIVGDSEAARDLKRSIEEAARHRRPVLLHGEPGTGKRTAAVMIHRAGGRAVGPFVVVDCGASPEGMLTAELFGGQGRDPGASVGRVGIADGGTLVLDRIDLTPLGCQARIARLLSDGVYERGDGVESTVDVRVIATSVRDVHRSAESGSFRRDVLERLGSAVISVAPLAERVDDIPFLVEHFVDRLGPRSTVRSFGPEAMELLSAYEWPGNVRELEILVHRLGVLDFGDEIMPEHLPPEISGRRGGGNPYVALVGMSIHDIEREMILKTLDETAHNKTAAAKILGLTARTLHNKLRLYREQGIIEQTDYRPVRRPLPHSHPSPSTAPQHQNQTHLGGSDRDGSSRSHEPSR